MYDNILVLLTTETDTNEYGAPVEEIVAEREVYAEITSISMKESYEALAVGQHPEIKAIISDIVDYAGERYAKLADIEYRITRNYRKGLSVELTLERVNDNARS